MIVRNMQKADVEAVWEIENYCFSQPWSIEAFHAELENPYSITLIAVENDSVAGFLNVRNVGGEIYINNIAVAEAYRKRGVATTLLQQLERTECSFITLEVRKSNHQAIALYEKLGYVLVGERKNFYEKPVENALLYTKSFG